MAPAAVVSLLACRFGCATSKFSFASHLINPLCCSPRRLAVAASLDNGPKKVLVISGPTGAGKSRLAMELAKRLNGEIISADSVQVYRGLDIGSAKPPPSDREAIPHHPSEDYSAGQFFEDARQATENIVERGHVPIVAGGTGLYLRWYMYWKPDVPKSIREINSDIWSELLILQNGGDWEAAVELVGKAGDPKARLLACNDWYRLRRSLEIIDATGSLPSAFEVPYESFKAQADSENMHPSRDIQASPANGNENIFGDLNCEEMLTGDQGLLTETTWLLDSGLLPNTNSPSRAIGYRQAMEYLLRCREQGGHS